MSTNEDKAIECVNRLDHLALRVGQSRETLSDRQLDLLSEAIGWLSRTLDHIDELGEMGLANPHPRVSLPQETWQQNLNQNIRDEQVTAKLTKIKERMFHGR
jgi:hypothetical protein